MASRTRLLCLLLGHIPATAHLFVDEVYVALSSCRRCRRETNESASRWSSL